MTSEILKTAAAIAERFEAQGEAITLTEAIDRAISAYWHLAQIEALRVLDRADTVPCPVGAAIASQGGQ